MRNSGIPLSKLNRKMQDQVAAQLWNKAAGKALTAIEARSKPYPFTLWLDYRIPSLNPLLGRKWRAIKEKTLAKEALAAALAFAPGFPRAGPGRMHVIITSYVCQPRDTDNPVPKFLIDQLRYAGVLRDDDPGSMFHTMQPEVRVAKRKQEGTKVTIAEALP